MRHSTALTTFVAFVLLVSYTKLLNHRVTARDRTPRVHDRSPKVKDHTPKVHHLVAAIKFAAIQTA